MLMPTTGYSFSPPPVLAGSLVTMDFTFRLPSYTESNHSNCHHSNATMDDKTLQDTEFYVESFVQNGIFICGIVFNAINLHILRSINLGENYRLCLLALTACDLVACVFGVLQLTIEGIFFRSSLPFGYWNDVAYFDYLLYFVFLNFMCTSSAYVILIAVIRTYTLHKPIHAIRIFTQKRLKRACCAILLVTSVLFLPTCLYGIWQSCFKDEEHPNCKVFFEKLPNADKLRYYFYFLSIIFGPAVIIINIVCLIAMKRALKEGRQTASNRLNRRPRSVYKMVKRHSKITRTLTIILILDTVWIVPTCVQYVGLVLSPEDTIFKSDHPGYKLFDLIAEILLALRPTYTIFVFLVTNKDFRRKFSHMLCCCCAYEDSPMTSLDFNTPPTTRRKSSDPVISPHQAILRNKNRDVMRNLGLQNSVPVVKKQLSWHPDKIEEHAVEQNVHDSDVTGSHEYDVSGQNKCDVSGQNEYDDNGANIFDVNKQHTHDIIGLNEWDVRTHEQSRLPHQESVHLEL